jgi:hypothetical protein
MLGHEPTGWDYNHENDPNAPSNIEAELEKLEPDHGHNDYSQLVAIPISDEEIEAAAKVDYVKWKQEHAKKPHKGKRLKQRATEPLSSMPVSLLTFVQAAASSLLSIATSETRSPWPGTTDSLTLPRTSPSSCPTA